MILTFFAFFLKTFTSVIQGIGSLFYMPTTVYTTIEVIVEKMMLFDKIIPVGDMIKVIIMLISFEIVILIIRVSLSIINWFRGAGGISLDI